MAPFKFGKKKHSDSASQKTVSGSQTASPQASTSSNNANITHTNSFNPANSPAPTSSSASPQYQQLQNSAGLAYDQNNNIHNPRSPQRSTPSSQGSTNGQFPYGTPKRQFPYGVSPHLHQPGQMSTPWSRSKLLISPFPRYRHAASSQANEKGEIFVMGGLHKTSVYGDTWILKQDETGVFQTFQVDIYENSPAPRVGHASTLCGNAYVIFGGDTVTNDAGEIDNDLYLFNVNSHTWTIPRPVGQKPPGRYGHTIGVIAITNFDSKLYLYGGQLDDVIYKDLVVFNLSSFRRPDVQWEVVIPEDSVRPPPLTNHSMDVYENKLWIFGGSTGEKLSQELWTYNPLTNRWEQINATGSIPPPLEEHASVVYKDLLIVHGGKLSNGEASPHCFILNLVTKVWFKLPSGLKFEAQGKYGHSISILKNEKLLLLGGHLPDYANLGDDLEPSNTDNGVGTVLSVLDLSSISRFIPGLYQYGTPTRNHQDKFPNYQKAQNQRESNQHAIFTPPVQNQTSPIKNRAPSKNSTNSDPASSYEVATADTGVTPTQREPSGASFHSGTGFTGSDSTNKDTKRTISAEDVFQHQFAGDETAKPAPPSDNYKYSQDKQQTHFANAFSPPEEELPLEIPPPLQKHKEDIPAPLEKGLSAESVKSPESTDALGSHEESYMNSSTRVSEFFDSYVKNDSQLYYSDADIPSALDEKNPVDSNNSSKTASTAANIAKDTQTAGQNIAEKAVELSAAGLAVSGAIAAKTFGLLKSDSKSEERNVEQESSLNDIPGSFKASTTPGDEKEQFKSVIQSLSVELENLKVKTNEQAKVASEKVKSLEAENKELKAQISEPKNLENESETKRNSHSLKADHQILKESHEALKLKLDEIEPLVSKNLIDLNTLNDIIKKQELELSESRIKLREGEDWKLKHDELNLKYETLLSKFEALEGKSKDGENDDNGDDSDIKQLTNSIDTFLSKYTITDEDTDEIKPKSLVSSDTNSSGLVTQLRSQIDELLEENETSQTKYESLAKEVEELKSQNSEIVELQARIAELTKIEENYKESLLSVKNSSRALQVSQNEISKQKEEIIKLQQEIDELKIFSAKKQSRNVTPLMNDQKNKDGSFSNEGKEDSEDFENEHYNLKIRDLQAELFITKQDNDDLKREILTLKKKLLIVNTPTSSL